MTARAVRLEALAKNPKRRMSKKELSQLEHWLQEDWEAADHDREILTIIHRLLLNATTKKKK